MALALQLSVALRNARANAFETAVGTDAVLKMFTGAQPANCAAANSGSELLSITCPTDWMAAASAGAKALSGSWSVSASGSGTPGHFRLYASDGTTCHAQGTVGTSGTDMVIDSATVTATQTVTITTFGWTEGQA